MGRHHAAAARRAGGEVVAVVDRDAAARASLGRRFPAAVQADAIGSLPAGLACDVAHVCTPVDSHLPLAGELAARGIHCLIEKPLATTAAETRQLADTFAAAELFFCPVHQYAFQPAVEEAIHAIDPVMQVQFDIVSAGGAGQPGPLDTIAAEILPHPLSMVQRLRPEVALRELDWRVTRAADGEWNLSAAAERLLVVIGISMTARPTRFITSLRGARDTVEIDNFHGYAVRLSGTVSRAAKIRAPFERSGRHLAAATRNLAGRVLARETAYPGLRPLIARFYHAVRERDDRALPITPGKAIDLAAARDTILAAVADQAR